MGLANSFARGNLRAKPRSSPVYIRFGRARGVNADTKKKGKERERERYSEMGERESLCLAINAAGVEWIGASSVE